MKPTTSLSSKLLLAIAGLSPLLLFAPASQASPVNNIKQAIEANSPFIDAGALYNTLERKQNAPQLSIPSDVLQQDGGTGKEASDPKQKESKDGKESCEAALSCNIMTPGTLQQEVYPPGPPAVNPEVIQIERPTELFPGNIF